MVLLPHGKVGNVLGSRVQSRELDLDPWSLPA